MFNEYETLDNQQTCYKSNIVTETQYQQISHQKNFPNW